LVNNTPTGQLGNGLGNASIAVYVGERSRGVSTEIKYWQHDISEVGEDFEAESLSVHHANEVLLQQGVDHLWIPVAELGTKVSTDARIANAGQVNWIGDTIIVGKVGHEVSVGRQAIVVINNDTRIVQDSVEVAQSVI